MRSLANNANNDLVLNRSGNLAFVTDIDAVAQNTRTAMQAQRGEMVYQVNDGMPTRATAFDRFNPAQFEAAARAVIMAVEGVESILSFSARKVDDVVVYETEIQTIYGTTVVTNGV